MDYMYGAFLPFLELGNPWSPSTYIVLKENSWDILLNFCFGVPQKSVTKQNEGE